ncbi:hypothetical protein D3C80_2115870 [compost metagenome]
MTLQVIQQPAKQLFSFLGVLALLLFHGGLEHSIVAAGGEHLHACDLHMLAAAVKHDSNS